MLFELALTFETFIMLTFWPFMYKDMVEHPHYAPLPNMIEFHMDHSLPFTCIVIDCFMNQIKFANVHVWLVAFLYFVYLIVNFSWTTINDHPVYRKFTWQYIYS